MLARRFEQQHADYDPGNADFKYVVMPMRI